MKILFIGDIVGEPGRRVAKALLPRWREEKGLDLVVANAENAAGGSGITEKIASELLSSGIDVLTSGDHIWDQKETQKFISNQPRLLRPLNYPRGLPGLGSIVVSTAGGVRVGVLCLQGRTFMPSLENPFVAALEEVARLRQETSAIVVDFHAEATSEKIALARLLDGRISACIGTHTHVQTADEQLLPNGTAFLCDAGFTGPHDSILGREVEPVIQRFLTGLPQRFGIATGRVLLQGALLEVDPATGLARGICRVSEPLPTP